MPRINQYMHVTAIVPDSGTIVGSTLNATTSGVFAPFYSSSGPCAYHSDSPGVWYSLNGTGHGHIISVHPIDTIASVSFVIFSGDFGRLQCLASTLDYDNNSFSIGTKIGVKYLILVRSGLDSTRGDFGLTVSTYGLKPNDACSGAVTIVPGKGPINGSTHGASFAFTARCKPFPFEERRSRSPDLWYRIDGTGKTLTASIECDHGGANEHFDTTIEVFESVDGTCTTLSCVASGSIYIHEDYGCQANDHRATWSSTLGKAYLIRVYGGDDVRNFGPFKLLVD